MANLDRRNFLMGVGTVAGAAVLAGCGTTSGSTSGSAAGSSAGSSADKDKVVKGDPATCDAAKVTYEQGYLTVATGDPAWEPWVKNDDPASGEGFEAAVIYAVADKMGFPKDTVLWTRTTFDEAYAPGDKDWDMNIQQVSITDERKKAVDFSPAYYRPTQSVIAKKDSDFASAKSVSDLKDATFAVMTGTTAYDFVKDIVFGGDDSKIELYNNNSDAVAALDAKQVDVLVTDTPQCVYMVQSEQVTDGVVVGQLPGTEDPDGLGIVLPLGSKLTSYVTDALNALLDDGTIDGLVQKWLKDYVEVPELTA